MLLALSNVGVNLKSLQSSYQINTTLEMKIIARIDQISICWFPAKHCELLSILFYFKISCFLQIVWEGNVDVEGGS